MEAAVEGVDAWLLRKAAKVNLTTWKGRDQRL